MNRIIGIDFGTTYSRVSVWDPIRQAPVIIPNLAGELATPSVVGINDAGEVIVGEDAKQNSCFNPANTVWQIKREMGRDFKVTMGGQIYSPQTIAAFILRYLKICAERSLGEPVYDAVITVPAHFTEIQRGAIRDAGAIAGLNVHRLVNEPTAAAIAYGVKSGLEPGARKIYAVYDLGGGTFDASIIDITAEDITVLGTGGDPRLGGLDMDEEMVKWTLRQIEAAHGIDLRGDEAVRRRLMLEVEGVKKRLAQSDATDLIVPFLTMIDGQPFSLKLAITRPQYERLIQKILDQSLICLEEAVASAREKNQVGWEDLDGVLLVGGATRLRRISDMLREKLREKFEESGRPDKPFEIKCGFNPDDAVALGAAIVAAPLIALGRPPEDVERMRAGDVERLIDQKREGGESAQGFPDIHIYDVTGHSLGIAIREDRGIVRFRRVIDKETVIPVSQTVGPFSIMEDSAREVTVEIYEGEHDSIQGNTKIGELRIKDPDPRSGGQRLFNITLTLDSSGILSTVCTDLRTDRQHEATFKLSGIARMSREDIATERRAVTEAFAPRGPAAPGPPSTRLASPGKPLSVDENVQFTVYRPRAIEPAKWWTLLAFAHLSDRPFDAPASEPDPVEEVKRQARQVLGDKTSAYQERTQDSLQAVPREGELTFLPEVAGVEFNPPSRSFLWIEPVHREEFRFRASAGSAGQTLRGSLSVFLGRILLADVPLVFRVDAVVADRQAPAPVATAARPYRKIFASYSHRDLRIVEEFERFAAVVGDRYLRDWVELRAGEIWSERLAQMIEEADIFQLFWSTASMTSPFVRQEWECALSLGRPGFIRPVYWEDPFPESPDLTLPPAELRRLHFQRLSLTPVEQGALASAPGTAEVPGPRFRTPDSIRIRPEELELEMPPLVFLRRRIDLDGLNKVKTANSGPAPRGSSEQDRDSRVVELISDAGAFMEKVKNHPPRTPEELDQTAGRLQGFIQRGRDLLRDATPGSLELVEGLTRALAGHLAAIGAALEVLRLQSEFQAILSRLQEPVKSPEALDQVEQQLRAIKTRAEALPGETSVELLKALNTIQGKIEEARSRFARSMRSVKASPGGGTLMQVPWVGIALGVLGLATFVLLLILRGC